MALLNKIQELSKLYFEDVRRIRRHLHAHPELSFDEHETAKFVESELDKIGITDRKRMAKTGIVALIEGKNPQSRTVALRGDLDALPIQELNNCEYKSTMPGVMHACGHDVHTSSLLGAARILNETKADWEGTVKLIFQPGEEKLPGGASLLIEEGVLFNPAPQSIYGQHVMPFIQAGKVGFRKGLYMASTDEIYMTVHGKGGHGAMPHLNIDPILIAANIITALQQVVSRRSKPIVPSVLSIGKVIANGATNVIPNEVYMEGTFRTLDEAWRDEAHKHIRAICESTATSMGGSIDLQIERGYPHLINDVVLTEAAIAKAETYLGKENVLEIDIWMAAEDFSYYSQAIPACFYRLGTRNEALGIISSVHTPTFDIDETALETGMGLMAWMAVG